MYTLQAGHCSALSSHVLNLSLTHPVAQWVSNGPKSEMTGLHPELGWAEVSRALAVRPLGALRVSVPRSLLRGPCEADWTAGLWEELSLYSEQVHRGPVGSF